MYDLIIIGSGAAGLAAGIYAGRYRLKTLIIEGSFGGATATAGWIANYPGVKPIDGYEFMNIMKEQASDVGVEFKSGWAEKIERDGHCFKTFTKKEEIDSKAIIFTGGAEHRKLGLQNEEVLMETEVKEIVGEKMLEKIILSKPYNGSSEIIVDGLFIEIGAVPSVALPKSLGVELDEHGYVKVDNMMKTNIDGFFAAGDVVSHFGRFKQDITAAAMGTGAATSTYEDNKIHGDLCQLHGIPTQ